MRATPFLELKLNATPVPFLLEVFRLSDAYVSASQPPHNVVRVEARLPNQPRRTRDRNINDLSRQDVEQFTGGGASEWTLRFHIAIDDEATWKSLFEFELLDVGGTLPLLVRLLGYTDGLDSFATSFITRCLTLWDGKFVYIRPDAQGFVKRLLEASGLPAIVHDTGIIQLAETAQRESQEPDRGPERTPAGQGILQAPNTADGPAAPIARATGATQPPRKIREGTAEDLERLKALFIAKKQGARRNLSWSRACDEAGTTVKTAGVYLPDIKAQWIAMDKAQRQQKSTQPRKRPGRK